MNPRPFLERLNAAIEGIIYAAKTQRSVRLQFLAAFVVLLVSLFLPLTRTELLFLFFTIILVIFAELVNTSVEQVVNLFSPSPHPLAKAAKDVAAGAVFIACFGALVMAYFIIFPALSPFLTRWILITKHSSEYLTFAALTAVIVLVVVLKAVFGRGTPLYGGMPSGHAALAFALGTALTVLTENPLVMLLSFFLALLVSTSRLLHGIHTKLEVALGAILGTLVTALMFQVFR
ncbi:MAG: diacylglycerol kinase [candidate division NC10 bacterium]|nr:diacylglycerol kinase [candidate division NC10 bacterium]